MVKEEIKKILESEGVTLNGLLVSIKISQNCPIETQIGFARSNRSQKSLVYLIQTKNKSN